MSADVPPHMLEKDLIRVKYEVLTSAAKGHTTKALHVKGKHFKLHHAESPSGCTRRKPLIRPAPAFSHMTPGAILTGPSTCRLTALYKKAKAYFGGRRQATAEQLEELCRALGAFPNAKKSGFFQESLSLATVLREVCGQRSNSGFVFLGYSGCAVGDIGCATTAGLARQGGGGEELSLSFCR